MLAKRIPTIMPDLTLEEALEVTRVHQRHIKKYCSLDSKSKNLLKMAINELGLSAKAYDRIFKVSRTIADLAGSESILAEYISEAIQYRSLDGQWW